MVEQVLDDRLARFVGRMGLAGEQKIDRPVVVDRNLTEPLDIVEDQIGTLVGGEPTGKADGEDLRFQTAVGVNERREIVRRIDPGHAHLGTMQDQHPVDGIDEGL